MSIDTGIAESHAEAMGTPEKAQQSMAKTIGAHVRTSPTGHLPMISRPGDVTATIESAAH